MSVAIAWRFLRSSYSNLVRSVGSAGVTGLAMPGSPCVEAGHASIMGRARLTAWATPLGELAVYWDLGL